MATQSDLDKLKKQLSDLDAKLKSMRGNSPQRNPNFDLAMANQNFKNSMAEQSARMEADRANRQMVSIPPPEQGSIGAVPPTQERLKELEIFNKMVRGETLTPEELQQRKIQERKQVPVPPPERGQYTQGRLMGAPTDAPLQFGRPRPVAPMPIYPQNPQMQDYNNLLQQGIQRGNTMNQGAISPGMGMQQPKATPAPRNFSTVNTPSARFG